MDAVHLKPKQKLKAPAIALPDNCCYWFFFDLDQTLMCQDTLESKRKLNYIQKEHLSDSGITNSKEIKLLALYANELSPILQNLTKNPLTSLNIITKGSYDSIFTISPFIELSFLGGDNFNGRLINRSDFKETKGDHIKRLLTEELKRCPPHHVILIDNSLIQRESAKWHGFKIIDPTTNTYIENLNKLIKTIADPSDTSGKSKTKR
ncbi:hypothetical protein [Pelagibaculum spongiae]|uniref:FCP1 homology domain-containing protein n=1 Tax=Pelagibaculum spongiae TaxID=2080658 RepID=A0A2V1GZH8_9GAMM|nr:hypothetical protein [Pelagibaculum spongiae]PVZ72146.1 hypothetical protein DC094_03790 [Pelagibaculum spongiae]